MNKPVRYNGQINCFFTEDGDIIEHHEKNSVLGVWTKNGYKAQSIDVSYEWLAHWNIDSEGVIEKANPAVSLGRKGGSSTSKAKQKSSAANGKLGGRPKSKDKGAN
jgi:hypothetical protein